MRRPAERRAQATAEWLAVIGGVALAFAAGGLLAGGLPQRIADRLDPPVARPDLAAAAGGRAGALTLAGAQAWLAEDVGPVQARAAVERAVVAELHAHHAAWLGPTTLSGAPIRGRRTRAAVVPFGPVAVRVVRADDERRARATTADRIEAETILLGWSGVGALARRLARPLGLAVGAAQLALGLVDEGEARQPPGTRAGDAIVCRRAALRIASAATGRVRRASAWRVGVLRDGRLVLDALSADDPCRAPAG